MVLPTGKRRLMLIMPTWSYRANDFLTAARQLEIDVVFACEYPQALAKFLDGRTLTLDFLEVETDVQKIKNYAEQYPLDAVIGVDEKTVLLAAQASQILGLCCNKPGAIEVANNKYSFRVQLSQSDINQPWFRKISLEDDVFEAACLIDYPCVVKPLDLSASRGVIRVNNKTEFVGACERIDNILKREAIVAGRPLARSVLAEEYLPGVEVAFEGILDDGNLIRLALFDKPSPLVGPYFEETIYVTPSRLPVKLKEEVLSTVKLALNTIGLFNGPIHAELRIHEDSVTIIELAARSIGGCCSRSLTFSDGVSLEYIILRQALSLPFAHLLGRVSASGVMMIPIPAKGYLMAVDGVESAQSVNGINEVIITIPVGDEIIPLPEGDRYLGFIFATGTNPDEVEHSLHSAHSRLRFLVREIS